MHRWRTDVSFLGIKPDINVTVISLALAALWWAGIAVIAKGAAPYAASAIDFGLINLLAGGALVASIFFAWMTITIRPAESIEE